MLLLLVAVVCLVRYDNLIFLTESVFGRTCEQVDLGVFERDKVYNIQILMSQPESFAHRDADGCEVSSVLSAPSGFWLCCPRGCPHRAASSPGSTGWSGPSPAGSGWSAGPYTVRRSESRRWTAEEGGQGCLFPPTHCWPCDWRGPRAAAWQACVWSFSLWMCTGRCRCQRTAASGSGDLVLFSGCGPLSESGRTDRKILTLEWLWQLVFQFIRAKALFNYNYKVLVSAFS